MWSYTTTTFPGEAGAERHKAAGRANPAVPRERAEGPRELAEVRQAQARAGVRQGRAIAAVRRGQGQAPARQERV